MLVWVILSCVALVCAHALLWLHGRRARRLLAGLPTFPQLPFIGNAHQVLKSPEHLMYLLTKTAKISDEKQAPFVCWLGPVPFIVLIDPADIKAANNAYLEKSYIYQFLAPFLGKGIFTTTASLWRHTSKKLTGALSSSVVAHYQDVFNSVAQRLVGELKEKAGNAPFDIHENFAINAMETIYILTLGKRILSEQSVALNYSRRIQRLLDLSVLRGLNPLLHLDLFYRLSSVSREMKKYADSQNYDTEKAIKERIMIREEIKRNGKLDGKDDNVKDQVRPYVDILLDLSEIDPVFTTKQMVDEMNTIFFGGYDTVATSLGLIAVALGKNPDIQDKLYAEMKEIFGVSRRPVEKEDLARMRYCEAVINESLRLYPPAPAIMRKADRDLKIKSCTIPGGCVCIMNIWGSGRSTWLWGPDAEQFRPERWLQQDFSEDAVLVAFSYGRRGCIGRIYAMAYMKTVLAHCIRELLFTGEEKALRFDMKLTLRCTEGHLAQVHLRNRTV